MHYIKFCHSYVYCFVTSSILKIKCKLHIPKCISVTALKINNISITFLKLLGTFYLLLISF